MDRLPDNTMDGADFEDRPHKRRRFFENNESSPVVQSIQRYSSPPPAASSQPSRGIASSPIKVASDNEEEGDAIDDDGFDTGLLQAVVGKLPRATMEKLKDQSGKDVQRGVFRNWIPFVAK